MTSTCGVPNFLIFLALLMILQQIEAFSTHPNSSAAMYAEAAVIQMQSDPKKNPGSGGGFSAGRQHLLSCNDRKEVADGQIPI